jgi:archaemetzincin
MGASEGPSPVDAIHLLPLGPLPTILAEDLASRLSRRVPVPCRVVRSPAEMDLPRLADRDQIDADALLARLEQQAANPSTVLVGVAVQDLAIPVFTFVFGRARQGGRAALVSLARLDPVFYGSAADGERRTERAVTEMLHELGHLASLAHCEDAACLMNFAGSVERVDVRGSVFCDRCAARLPGWLRAPRRSEAVS